MSFGSMAFMLPMRICAPRSSRVMKTQSTTAVTKGNLIQPIEDTGFFGQNCSLEFFKSTFSNVLVARHKCSEWHGFWIKLQSGKSWIRSVWRRTPLSPILHNSKRSIPNKLPVCDGSHVPENQEERITEGNSRSDTPHGRSSTRI